MTQLIRNALYGLGVMVAMLLLTVGCERETGVIGVADGAKVRVECDTVAFDTVFTTMGTVTKSVKLYNPYDATLKIASITLRGGAESRFRINVDGDTAQVVRDVEILPHDSIFVFVRANINPNSALEPFLIEDAIEMEGMGHIVLQAYGRNAVYHIPSERGYSIIDCEHWDHTRPHVLMGYAVVDSACTLTLQAGDELYFGNDAVLWVYNNGTLKVDGNPEQPVLFTSVRQDGRYRTLPGQWGYIWLSTGSIDNEISWAQIENGYVGILADTNVNGNPTLRINHTKVQRMSLAGIIGQGSYIVGDHVLVSDCKTATISLQYGGRYCFRNSTFANYWQYGGRTNGGVVLNNWYQYNNTIYLRPLVQAEFDNCIVYGSYDNELLYDSDDRCAFNVHFDHCLLKGDSVATAQLGIPAKDCLWNEDPLFDSRYGVGEESPAKGSGDTRWLSSVLDVFGQVRRLPPTLGAAN